MKIKLFEEFLNETEDTIGVKTEWIRASELKVGDRILDQNDNKISTIKSTKPYLNGFKELIGATITWDDGTHDVYRGDLLRVQ